MLTPSVQLPDSLRGNEAGTFTADSVVRRLPGIAQRAIEENALDTETEAEVNALAAEINSGLITQLDEPVAADAEQWATYVEPHLGKRWIDVPWFFAETYFYRRLLAATGYSRPGPQRGVDPFAYQKRSGLDGSLGLAAPLADALGDTGSLLRASLWANSVDLSLWPAGGDGARERIDAVLGPGRDSHLLVDDGAAVVERLDKDGINVHLVLDNSGAELLADLALAAGILSRGGRVFIHVKPHPTFVSDVTRSDLATTISTLAAADSPAPELGGLLNAGLADGALQSAADPFWVSPLPFWACPPRLVDQLAGADLVIVKGDANYRRLLGDLHWDLTTPFAAIVRPLQPTVAIRTSKSLVGAGLSPATIEAARNADHDWMVSGEWGMIQFAEEVG